MLQVYFAVIAFAFALAFVADTSLYPFWGFKLDASCLQYLSTPGEAVASVTTGYLIARGMVVAVTTVVIAWGYWKGMKGVSLIRGSKEIRETVFYVMCLPVMAIGIRGGINESTTNIGQAYFSQNQFLNHAAVNPVFSFLSSFEKSANNIEDYDFFSESEYASLTKDLYPKTSIDADTLLSTWRPNIVVVLMESAGDIFRDVMPQLQQLRKEGIDFTNCYGNTWRTDRGTLCTYSGYPSFPTSSVMKMPKKSRHLPSIASALRQEGYHTYYLYGGDIDFTNMRSYLISTGWEQLTWMADYTREEQSSANWGVRDDITFNTLYEQIVAMPQEELFLIGFSTLSSHEPWDVPIKKYDKKEQNAFYYLDLCIGEFISKLKKTPQWENLLVIFLPDHSIDFGKYTETHPLRNKIPLVWVGGAVKAHQEITQLCNQTDLAATLLAQMHLSHQAFRWSRDVLSSSYQYPFAVHNYNNGFSLIDSTGFIVYDLGASQLVKAESSRGHRLERMGKAILQATTADLKALGTK